MTMGISFDLLYSPRIERVCLAVNVVFLPSLHSYVRLRAWKKLVYYFQDCARKAKSVRFSSATAKLACGCWKEPSALPAGAALLLLRARVFIFNFVFFECKRNNFLVHIYILPENKEIYTRIFDSNPIHLVPEVHFKPPCMEMGCGAGGTGHRCSSGTRMTMLLTFVLPIVKVMDLGILPTPREKGTKPIHVPLFLLIVIAYNQNRPNSFPFQYTFFRFAISSNSRLSWITSSTKVSTKNLNENRTTAAP